jgi:hypothetical protein
VNVWFMDDVVVPLVIIAGVWCFVLLARGKTRAATRKSTKTAESMYDNYSDPLWKQRQYARAHGGTWKDDSSVAKPSGPTEVKAP